MRKRERNVAIGTVVAAGLGYALGVLTAPKSGKETRKDIQKAAVKAKTEAERKLKSLHSDLGHLINDGKKRAAKLTAAGKQDWKEALTKAETAKAKAREMLSAIHEGDADDQDLDQAIKDIKSSIAHLKKYLKNHGQET
jgi:gas vesicle protein